MARKAFGRNGFHGVSMEEVARDAGVTKPILYDHFNSKRDLYLALIEADAADLQERVGAALVARTGNRERIRASYQAYFDFVDEHAEGFRLVMQEAQSPASMSSAVDTVRERILQEVAKAIMAESGKPITKADADMLAVGLVAMVEAGAQRTPGVDTVTRKRQLDVLLRLAWRGMAHLG
ncbi:MAG: TetR/AcrR family transcriptional regulator [Actinomycetota bacterium]